MGIFDDSAPKRGKRVERPGTGWGRSDSGSGQSNEGCVVVLLAGVAGVLGLAAGVAELVSRVWQ